MRAKKSRHGGAWLVAVARLLFHQSTDCPLPHRRECQAVRARAPCSRRFFASKRTAGSPCAGGGGNLESGRAGERMDGQTSGLCLARLVEGAVEINGVGRPTRKEV